MGNAYGCIWQLLKIEAIFLSIIESSFYLLYVQSLNIANSVKCKSILAINWEKNVMIRVDFEIKGVMNIIGGVHFGERFDGKWECFEKNTEKGDFGLFIFGFVDDLLYFRDIECFLIIKMRDCITVIDYILQLPLLITHRHPCNCVISLLFYRFVLFLSLLYLASLGFFPILDKVNDVLLQNPAFSAGALKFF